MLASTKTMTSPGTVICSKKLPRAKHSKASFYIVLATCFLFLTTLFPASANTPATSGQSLPPQSFTVGVVADNEPYSSSEGRVARGFSIDVLNKLSETLNIRFDYRVGSWPDIYAAFLRGELDIIDEISWREDRAEKILFTPPYHLRQTVVMQNNAQPLPEIKKLAQLRPYRVGVMRDIYYRDYLKEQGIDVIEYDLLPNLVQALAFGWVDTIIGPEITLKYMARRDGFFQLETNALAPLKGMEIEDFRLGTLKDRPELFQKLQAGLQSLPADWLQELNQRWMLYDGQLPLHQESLQLSQKQSAYLSRLPPLRVGFMRDYAPFSFSENGKVQGLSVDILYRLQEMAGVEFVPVVDQWSNLLDLFEKGELDLIANISDLPERRSFTRFTQPYHRIPNVAFTRDANFRLNKASDLSGKRIALTRGVFYEGIVRRLFPDQVIGYTEQSTMFKALAENQVDIVLTALPNGNHWIRELGMTDIWIAGELQLPGLAGEDLRLGLQPELQPLREILDLAMNNLSQTEKRAIENRWLGAKTTSDNSSRIPLTKKEQELLNNWDSTITYCIHPDHYPLESQSWEGHHEGMSASLLTVLQQKLDRLSFKHYPTDSWEESLKALENGHCALIPMIVPSQDLQPNLLFSDSWYNAANVILGNLDSPFINSINDLSDKPIGISRDNNLRGMLEQRYPQLQLKLVNNSLSGIQQVREHRLYGFIGGLAETSHLLQQESFGDIRVLGRLPMDSNFSIAVNSQFPQLLELMNKLLDSLTPKELDRIENNWLAIRLEQKTDYTTLWQLAAGFSLLFLALFFWNRKLDSLNQQLTKANEQLAHLSVTDQLTELGNRNYLNQTFAPYVEACRNNNQILALALLDADHFKQINDSYGHDMGDICLRALSDQMKTHFNRPEDHLIRFGGEEFIILTSGESTEFLAARLEALRSKVAETPIRHQTLLVKLSVSIGAVIQQASSNEPLDTWLKCADRSLYQAKEKGRNQLVVYDNSLRER